MKKLTVVDRAIAKFDGSQAEFARQLSRVSGEDVSRQRVFGWVSRGLIPRDMMAHVETLCGISLDEMIAAEPKDRDAGNIVNRAIRFLGEEAQASDLARELSKLAGKRVTRQMVNNWQAFAQFPVEMVPYVHILARIPVKDLLEGLRTRRRRSAPVRESSQQSKR